LAREKILKAALVVAFIVFSMQFLAPLQSPIGSPVIVKLSSDEPVAYTAGKTNDLLRGQAMVVTAQDDIARLFILPRAVGDVIIVGHGAPKGVKVGETGESWNDFAESTLTKLRSSRVYIAACYSQAAAKIMSEKYHESGRVVGFSSAVDADEAAYYVSSAIAYSRGDLNQARLLMVELTQVMFGKFLEPQKYNHWLLYYSQWVRGIDFIKYGERPYGPYSNPVRYTHPDTYGYYTWITTETWATLGTNMGGNNLQAEHIPRSFIDTYSPLVVFTYGLGGAGLAAEATWIIGAIAGLIAAILFLLVGLGITAFFDAYLRDETSSGWMFSENGYSGIFGLGVDFKIGRFMWLHWAYVWFLGSVIYPCGYPGGDDLGIDGI
jgi:hypothetical protein